MGEDHFLNLQPGTIVNGCYEVVKCLGAGSMGMVYACRHRELSGRLVAMKVLFSEVASDAVATARFRNEIFASYEVNHPNVVRAYEYFRDGDLIAFTMEYVGGGDIADRIASDEAVPVEEIVRMMTQMCAGVQAIHDAGIIHRDLKPENILLTAQGDIKITDFGIARTGSGPKLTEHGGVVGTIDYVSPEYLEIGQVDARSDIYALGVLGYELLTGVSPFKGKSVFETITMRLRSDPESPAKLRPDCPPGLADIVLKALRRDPELRYQSANQMLLDLKALDAGEHVSLSASLQSGREYSVGEGVGVGASLQGAAEAEYGRKRNWIEGWDSSSRSVEEPRGGTHVSSGAYSGNRAGSSLTANASGDLPLLRREDQSIVSVGRGRVSAERFNQLQQGVNDRPHLALQALGWLLVSLFGFGVGYFAINHLFPGVLGQDNRVPLPGYMQSEDYSPYGGGEAAYPRSFEGYDVDESGTN